MMYNTGYLPENFEQRRLEKTIFRHFPYNLNMRSRSIALIQDGRKNHESTYWDLLCGLLNLVENFAKLGVSV